MREPPSPLEVSARVRVPEDDATLRVLVADDDAPLRVIVARALRVAGLDVVEVGDGLSLLAQVASELTRPLDLIVSDVHMPGRSGIDVLEDLRAARRAMPVILMTRAADAAMRTRAERLGALVIDKPFDLPELRKAVLRLLSARRGGGPLPGE